jgi:hypothetical protein
MTSHPDEQQRQQLEFLELAERLRHATDPQEAKRLGDELGRMIFGRQRNL